MSRRPIDVVQKAFDLWADLTPDQKKQFHWSMEGYNMARKEAIAANGGVEPDRVAPRTRQRKAKPDVIDEMRLQHGKNCMKRRHVDGKSGYLHEADFDGPYAVDGVDYCGRCHEALPKVSIPKTA